jgi:hypothetical protein
LLLSTISTSPCLRVEIGLVVGLSRTSVMSVSAAAAKPLLTALQAAAVGGVAIADSGGIMP